MFNLTSHRRWLIVCFCLLALFLAVQSTWFLWNVGAPAATTTTLKQSQAKDAPGASCKSAVVSKDSWLSPSNSLNFPYPTTRARDNLRNDSYYVTAFSIGGFSNELIGAMQLIYLGILTKRIPILPPIIPAAHVSEHAGNIAFSDIFNLTTLRSSLRYPILEWKDVKSLHANVMDNPLPDDPALDSFGCWSTQKRTLVETTSSTSSENVLKLDLSYTRVPDFAFLHPEKEDGLFVKFSGVAAAIQPKYPHPGARGLPIMVESRFGGRREPDEQLACFDLMFYVSSGAGENWFEFEDRWSPVWNLVGTRFEFTEGLKELARGYVGRALGVGEGVQEIPPMITVHIRRGDFNNHCKDGAKPPCFIPNSSFKKAVEDLQARLLQTRNINASHVLVASDEKDPTFWSELNSYGWSHLNHTSERTHELYGEWYSVLLDIVAQSIDAAVGFVGTQGSTFSLISARRVEDWNKGETVMVSYYD